MKEGKTLTKFCRFGKPKQRFIYFSEDMKKICWKNDKNTDDHARLIFLD